MAGHSKWKQIKHKKAITDSKRGAAFTKLIKEITVCARQGGGDPAHNAKLRLLMEKAKEINMPLENTQRAIKRGTGELPGAQYEQYTYEGYGPNNVAVIVETLSDNKNRTVAEFRRIFSSNGGSLGETGTVNWMFTRLGVVRIPAANVSEEKLMEQLIDFPIADIRIEGEECAIMCDVKSLDSLKQNVADLGYKIISTEPEWIAQNSVALSDEQAERVFAFLEELDEHEDVQHIYTNMAE